MSLKQQKPTLSGQRIKTRKRDEKEKQDPLAFRDAIVTGLNGTQNDLEQVAKFLDVSGAKLNYRLYGDQLFDILFAGGILAPGGSIVEDGNPETWKTSACIFEAEENTEVIRKHVQVLNKLIARYRYLQKSFEDVMKKILLFLKGFTPAQRNKLAITTAIVLANGMAPATALYSLFNEQLLKEGIALQFVTKVFKEWVNERDFSHLSSSLKKAELENKILDFFPPNKQTNEYLEKHFQEHGLDKLISFQRAREGIESRKTFQLNLKEMLKSDTPVKEIIINAKDEMKRSSINEADAVFLIWKSVMGEVEWNKKEELVAEQALRHLKTYSSLFGAFTTSANSEISLLVKIQEYCYDNMNFMKVFQKIILLFYKTEVLSEDSIIKWYNTAHSSKGKSIFLEQMKKMIEWLNNAEEESSEEEEDDEN
ncbi:basic leucine zipper and W2 domain-containing protein 1 [Exaiptasia diaphana]|uniref:W2 domain-containing protein n=1 Tax=Exaiptasia diaphana TaxID=2652724 RepID=A0A913Y9E1_EXADI|nr:basic leucine zipper and W2 domain-containing protein 1 [Exaiptasia diaphana]KXJ21157.1 Basic leucine zipper and W2 domain-containing protein 1 [Exaiptasia diaphana]